MPAASPARGSPRMARRKGRRKKGLRREDLPPNWADEPYIKELLERARAGDARANDQLFVALYGLLRRIARATMRSQSPAHTLQATALVNEVFLKLARRDRGWEGLDHFLNGAARAMRSVLVDHARTRTRKRRRAPGRKFVLDDAVLAIEAAVFDVVALDEALDRL